MKLLKFALISLFGLLCTSAALAQKEVVFSMCNFPLKDDYRQANLSFTQSYRVTLDSEGVPQKLFLILGKELYVSNETVKACFSNWKFKGFDEGMGFLVTFRWDHGIGWTRVSVVGNGFSQKIVSGNVTCKQN